MKKVLMIFIFFSSRPHSFLLQLLLECKSKIVFPDFFLFSIFHILFWFFKKKLKDFRNFIHLLLISHLKKINIRWCNKLSRFAKLPLKNCIKKFLFIFFTFAWKTCIFFNGGFYTKSLKLFFSFSTPLIILIKKS